MDRTGIEQNQSDKVVELCRVIGDLGLEFRGLHYYDGQYGGLEQRERAAAAYAGYVRLLGIVSQIERRGTAVPEVITAGTPTFPCSLAFEGFHSGRFIHRVSPGTIVYGDATSLAQLPCEYGYRPAVLVLTRVVSQPRKGIVTCDAGHKAVSADAGVPTCVVVGHSELTPLSPSEEHLPMALQEEAAGPRVGEALYLLPRHVCPTVNNFDCALLVRMARSLPWKRCRHADTRRPCYRPPTKLFSSEARPEPNRGNTHPLQIHPCLTLGGEHLAAIGHLGGIDIGRKGISALEDKDDMLIFEPFP
jgi:D-serine deaminase-like pyridoxal phosphate-dependent protein